MEDIMFWTAVVGGTPLVVGFVQLAVERSREAFRNRAVATDMPSWYPAATQSWHAWPHA